MSIRLLLRRFMLLIAAVMIGASNVINEEDKMINQSFPQTEQEQNNEALNTIKNNG